ncbi:hypothetical protein NRS6084_03901 [Bacillus subtilis]|uniref:hypothetical protein n=1 Tax=Bacillus subtilis group TaxID=653685 RepID=UPI001B954DBB|nr:MULTISPECIES: hypothetical protein [Bacillus subtilis group]MCY7683151.1 hypothetical protein [Bacillus velezensis]CAF1772615.1 hypothetical protein NRS6084_03901 [Bacillus subtilis]
MNEYKINLSHDLVFHKRSNGDCTVTQGLDILPIDLETAVNLLSEEIIDQQDKIDEYKRQQEVTVHQFRQAQGEIQRLKQENTRYEYLLGESELSDKIQSICDHCKLTSGGREITIKDEEFGFLIEEANKSHQLQEENGRFKKALQIYAAENNYRRTLRMSKWATVDMENRYGDYNPSFMEVDRGQTARKALEGAAE